MSAHTREGANSLPRGAEEEKKKREAEKAPKSKAYLKIVSE